MRNSILLIVLALFCTMNITGCSLFSSGDEEQETATVAEEDASADFDDEGDDFGGEEFSDEGAGGDDDFDAEAMAKDEGTENPDELAGEDVEVEDSFGDEYPDDDYATKTAKVESKDDALEDYIDDNSFGAEDGGDELFVDEGGIPSGTMAANQDEDLFGGSDEMEPVVDTPTYADASFDGSGSFYDTPKLIPVKRMKPAAYKRAGSNINRLYVVRPGDNMDSIAKKIYGSSSRSKDLLKYNSHFKGKSIKVGDKIYYQSPKSPNDQQMMTYYEDNNIPAQYYTSQEGDNIRKVAKKLLGHPRSWMEVYATNENVATKDRIPAGLQVRYWPDGTAPAPSMAMKDPEPSPPPAAAIEPEPMPEPEPVAMNEPDEPSFDDEPEPEELAEPANDPAMAGMNNPSDPAASGGDDDFNPPPPTTAQVNPPPPPKPVAPPPPPPVPQANNFNKPKPPKFNAGKKPDITSDPLAALSEDSAIMGALGGLLILAAIIMLIFIRRSRAKRVNFSQTQV